ncbi:hypothetical protein DNL40_05160 [Xylanimonas oleitrophica]|uniref:Uncharacterized protein n=1 Tax=Xylanimonas oleitrophica TaxID=2607479 RepID=A0A2W5X0R4_9MICO|nr:hypothetical protein [Xylanimonas oleitrophica]PZR54296.1 hypothetical protein DNL40_05160 [Xylanimonas oleitrophica]
MSALHTLTAVLAAAPSPSPTSPARQLESTDVTPGLAGFLATFLLVVAAMSLFLLLTRSMRRTSHNARLAGIEVPEPKRVGGATRVPVAEGPAGDAAEGPEHAGDAEPETEPETEPDAERDAETDEEPGAEGGPGTARA